jgi:hypothetical protein
MVPTGGSAVAGDQNSPTMYTLFQTRNGAYERTYRRRLPGSLYGKQHHAGNMQTSVYGVEKRGLSGTPGLFVQVCLCYQLATDKEQLKDVTARFGGLHRSTCFSTLLPGRRKGTSDMNANISCLATFLLDLGVLTAVPSQTQATLTTPGHWLHSRCIQFAASSHLLCRSCPYMHGN